MVGASFWIGRRGLLYAPPFFDPATPVDVRAQAVRSNSGNPLLAWRPEEAPLAAIEADVAALTPEAVRAQRFRFGPSLVRRQLPDGRALVVPREP